MSLAARARSAALLALVAALSLALLIYVGWGEAKRAYPEFVIDKLVAQGEVVENAMAGHLRAGLPLREFPGFQQIAGPIMTTDPSIAAIIARDMTGAAVFSVGDAAAPAVSPDTGEGRATLRRDETWLQVSLPLRSRFEPVGRLEVTIARAGVDARIGAMLPMLAALACGLTLLFGGLAFRASSRGDGEMGAGIVGLYALIFIGVAAAVTANLVSLYSEGAQAKAMAVSDSLGQRIRPLFDYGLTLDDVVGLDQLLADYRRLNDDISAVGIVRDGVIVIHSDPAMIGQPWRAAAGAYEYSVALDARQNEEIRVGVVLPAEVVWKAVARSVKNFAALLLASGLFAAVFLRLAHSFRPGGDSGGAQTLTLMRPIFFLAVFADFLTAGFLPQLLRSLAVAEGLGENAASMAFTAYFAAFLLVLLPASAAVARHGARRVIVIGALIVAAASLIPVLMLDYWPLVGARALAGAGQGLLLIGVQSAVLAGAPPGGRTRAAAVIVLGFNGGMISGAAIGSLLVNDFAISGVFTLASLAALLLAIYSGAMIAPGGGASRGGAGFLQMLRDAPRACRSLGFLGALLLVGAPSKAVLTGVIVFGAPLFLSAQGWAAEDIGQIIMLYAASVLVATGPVARLVDRSGRSRAALMAGGLGSAMGLALIGMSGLWPLEPVCSIGLVLAGVVLIGLAHGCVNAPIIAFIAETGAARSLGAPAATALYRLLERVGHVLGPMLAALAFSLSGGGGAAFLWIGGALLVFTILFGIPAGGGQAKKVE
ncbi:MAG: MFS transporter [Paracoccaceae bacterium]